MSKKRKQYNRFYMKWYNLIFWMLIISVVIGALFTIFFEKEFNFINILLPSAFNTVVIWGGSMKIVVFVWRKFPWEKNPVKHIIVETTLILALLFVFVMGMGSYIAYRHEITLAESIQSNSPDILFTTLITFLIITIHEAVFFYRQWKFHFSKSVLLEKDKLEAQYNALKAQVNPHFLFNSLNSLMSLLDNNPVAEQYVQDLSEYLRYVLLSNSKEEVTLREETEHLEKFFHLQKLRFDNNLHVEINIQPAALNREIPPLALQMLVDNCIKHNIISSKNPLYIKISADEKSITVTNNLQRKYTEESTGQGLKNIEGRYRFLSNEPIKIISDDKYFSVTIPFIDKKIK